MARKDPAAVALGRKGGKARVKSQTVEERIESARRAAQARWAKTKKLVEEITEGTKELEKVALAGMKRATSRTRR
jgi:hypothetical protein